MLTDVFSEEQHDDQMLYEVLRCIKALSTSEIGKDALRAQFPRPFDALSGLLFSEKKPGDLPCRQLIIELWLFLFELFPAYPAGAGAGASAGVGAGAGGNKARPTSVRFDAGGAVGVAVDVVAELRKLVVPDIPDKTAEQHAFITTAHRPRVYRAWVQELSDICRDYFW